MARLPPSRRAAVVTSALVGAALWLLLHFALYGGAHGQLLAGELDILLPAARIAGGHWLGVVVGSTHGFQPGSYLEAIALAPLVQALGMVPASRLLASLVGASLAAVVGGGAAALAPGGSARWSAGALGAVLAASWPALHLECTSVWGSTPEAVAPAVLGMLLLVEGRSRRSTWIGGGLLGFSWLFGPWGLPALAIGVLGSRRRGRAALAALGVAIVLVALLPGGPVGVKAFLDKVMLGFAYARSPSGLGGDTWVGRLEPLLGVLSGTAPGVRAGRAGLAVGLLLVAAPALVARPRRGVLLLWIPVVLLQGAVQPAPRYGFALAAGLMVYSAAQLARRPGAAPRGAALLLLGTLVAPGALRPSADPDPWIRVGAHRMSRREPVGTSTPRYAAVEALLPAVPREHRGKVAFGFGAEVGFRLGASWEPPELWDWQVPGPLLAELGPDSAALALGVGCGLAALDALPPVAELALRPLAPWRDQVGWGRSLCGSPGRSGGGALRDAGGPTWLVRAAPPPAGALARAGLPERPDAAVRDLLALPP